jgi:tetratricopeptide (TPR) repeat protein
MFQQTYIKFAGWFFVFACLLFSHSGLSAQDFRKQYQSAKDLFNAGNYSASMSAFNALTVYDKNNPYNEYASFYYALSAYRLGYGSVAKTMLLQIKKLYPEWNQMNEVNYLLGKVYFEQKEYFQAMLVLDQLTDASFSTDIKNLKRVHLGGISDAEILRMMLEEHPDDGEVARAFVIQMGQLPYAQQDPVLMDSLITKFRFSREELVAENEIKPVLKDTYRIALVMPFLAATLDPSPVKKRNQFVLELYQGMKFAADTLAKMGMNIQLLAYDNERNLDATRKVLKHEELKHADLLVGPLFQEESKPLQEFSKTNEIGFVLSPLSNNNDFSAQNPYNFIFQPGFERIGSKSAELAHSKSTKKSCIVYYGETSKDSLMAFNFIKRARELNIKVLHTERVTKETTGSILTRLSTATEFDEWKNPLQFSLRKDSIGTIFVATTNELIYSKVINSVETRRDSTLVIGLESWLSDSSVDYAKFERIRIALAAPNFTSLASPAVQDFRKRFINRFGVLPTDYSNVGFEFVMVMGKILNKYGSNFLQTMPEGSNVDGTLMDGYTLSAQRDNQNFPFVTLKNGQLKKIVIE